MRIRTIFAYILTAVLLTMLGGTALANDLPIDIDAIGRHGEEQRGALTVRSGIDLFSEESEARVEAKAERQARTLEEAQTLLFQEDYTFTRADTNEVLSATAIENEMLFAEPIQVRTLTTVEDAPEMSLWLMVPVAVACAGLGLLIALRTKSKRKVREEGTRS